MAPASLWRSPANAAARRARSASSAFAASMAAIRIPYGFVIKRDSITFPVRHSGFRLRVLPRRKRRSRPHETRIELVKYEAIIRRRTNNHLHLRAINRKHWLLTTARDAVSNENRGGPQSCFEGMMRHEERNEDGSPARGLRFAGG